MECDYDASWYHGSPEELVELRPGSWVTQYREMARAFSHRPSLISLDDDGLTVRHDGQLVGYLYVVAEAVGPDDVRYLADTAGTHWETLRPLRVDLVAALSIDDPPQLTAAEIAEMRKEIPEGTTGFIGTQDPA